MFSRCSALFLCSALLVLACISFLVHLLSFCSLFCVANMPRGSVTAALACLGGLDTGALTQLSDISPRRIRGGVAHRMTSPQPTCISRLVLPRFPVHITLSLGWGKGEHGGSQLHLFLLYS